MTAAWLEIADFACFLASGRVCSVVEVEIMAKSLKVVPNPYKWGATMTDKCQEPFHLPGITCPEPPQRGYKLCSYHLIARRVHTRSDDSWRHQVVVNSPLVEAAADPDSLE